MAGKRILFILLFLGAHTCFAQNSFDQEISRIALGIKEKLPQTDSVCIRVDTFIGPDNNLGIYLSGVLAIELSNLGMLVIDRSRSDEDFREQSQRNSKHAVLPYDAKKGSFNALTPEPVLSYNYTVTGTFSVGDSAVYTNVKILRGGKGLLLGGIRGAFPKAELLRRFREDNAAAPGKSNATSGNGDHKEPAYAARKLDTENKSAIDDVFGAAISDLRTSECIKKVGRFNHIFSYGQICFENHTGEDIVFYCHIGNPEEGWLNDIKIRVPDGESGCSPLIAVNWGSGPLPNDNESRDAEFHFQSGDGSRQAMRIFQVEKCKVKSFVLTKKNLSLTR